MDVAKISFTWTNGDPYPTSVVLGFTDGHRVEYVWPGPSPRPPLLPLVTLWRGVEELRKAIANHDNINTTATRAVVVNLARDLVGTWDKERASQEQALDKLMGQP